MTSDHAGARSGDHASTSLRLDASTTLKNGGGLRASHGDYKSLFQKAGKRQTGMSAPPKKTAPKWGRHSCLPIWNGRQECLPHRKKLLPSGADIPVCPFWNRL